MDTTEKETSSAKGRALTNEERAGMIKRIMAINDQLPRNYPDLMAIYNPELATMQSKVTQVKAMRLFDEDIVTGLEHVAAIWSEARQKLESIGRLAREGAAR